MLRLYDTLKYGDIHEKFNFLKKKQTRFKTLQHLSKTIWKNLGEYASACVTDLRKVHNGIRL